MRENTRQIRKRLCFLSILAVLLLTGCGATGEENQTSTPGITDSQEAKKNADKETDKNADEKETNILHFVDVFGKSYETKILDAIPKNDYQTSNFLKDGEKMTYVGDENYTYRNGVDVSKHQGKINWKKVKAAGYDFAFLRIGYRGYGEEGTLSEDETFKKNYKAAKAAGVELGVYFFAQAVNEEEALEEAELTLDILDGRKLQFPVVYDPEHILDDEARTDDVSGEQFTKNTIAYCEAIKKGGYEPMIYGNMLWEAFTYDLTQLTDYPIWYADYEALPQTPYYYSCWQYSNKGKVDGIKGNVDVNIWLTPEE